MLITATPEQLGVDGHFARLRLLDPDRFHDLRDFRAEEENYRPIAELLGTLLDPGTSDAIADEPELQESLTAFLGAAGSDRS